jgi:hypothetical protein
MIWRVILRFKRRIVGGFSYYLWMTFGLFLCGNSGVLDLVLIALNVVNLLHENYVIYNFLVIICNYF